MMNQDELVDVVFVGAGPVGLYTAINTKLKNPLLQIVMLERNQNYTRQHILKIDPASFQEAEPNEAFLNVLGRLKGSVRTTEIEQQ